MSVKITKTDHTRLFSGLAISTVLGAAVAVLWALAPRGPFDYDLFFTAWAVPPSLWVAGFLAYVLTRPTS